MKIKNSLHGRGAQHPAKLGFYRIPASIGISFRMHEQRAVTSGHSLLAEVKVWIPLDVIRAKTSLTGVITMRCVQTAKCEGYRAGSLRLCHMQTKLQENF